MLPDAAQIFAYLAICALAGLYYGLLTPVLFPALLKWILQAVYGALTAGTLSLKVAAT